MKKSITVLLVTLVGIITFSNKAEAGKWFSTMKKEIIYSKPHIDVNLDPDPNVTSYVSISQPIALGYKEFCGFHLIKTCDTDKQIIVRY